MSNSIILKLTKQVKELGAGEGHIALENIQNEQGLNAVISVYDGVRPSHIVLGELYDWAETNNQEVKELIEKLSVPNDVERE